MKYLNYFFLLFCITLLAIFQLGCDDDVVTTDPLDPLGACIGDLTHYGGAEYDYMLGFSLMENGTSKFSRALDRARTSFGFAPAGGMPNTPYVCLIGSPGTSNQQMLYLLDYRDSFYSYQDTLSILLQHGNCLESYYIVGIDSFNYNDVHYMGITSASFEPGTSAVYAGKIRMTPPFKDSSKRAIEVGLLHEVGHGFGLSHISHVGSYYQNCVMYSAWPPGNIGFYRPLICSVQTCEMYNACSGSSAAVRDYKKPVSNNISVSIQSNKLEYFREEPIWISVKIKNISSTPEIINYQLEDISKIAQFVQLKDAAGNLMPYKGILGFAEKNSTTIHPNEEKIYNIQLSSYFGETIHKRIPYSPHSYLVPGSYSVYLPLGIDSEYISPSNNISFSIIEPQNTELSNLKAIQQYFAKTNNNVPNYDTKAFEADILLDILKESVYYDLVFYYYMTFRLNKEINLESYSSDCEKFIQKAPNSFYLYEVIGSAISSLERIGKKKETESFLKSIKENNSNTYASFIAEKYIEKANFKK